MAEPVLQFLPYPAFLRLEGRSCLIVGGGEIAYGKIGALRAAGARIVLVAKELCPALRALALSPETRTEAGNGSLEILRRPFRDGDLDGVYLLIAATDDSMLQRRLHALADERNILINVVDVPALCAFFAASVVRRGNLQIAVSTNGESPLLAAWIRRHLEAVFPPRWAVHLEGLGRARRRVRSLPGLSAEERTRLLRRLINTETMELLLHGTDTEFNRRMEQWSNSLQG